MDPKNAKYIIPAGAAVPTELSELPVVTGTTIAKLAAFETAPKGVLPLTEVEMNGLARCAELMPFQGAIVLIGLPGSFASAVFDSAVATAGLPTAFWEEVKAQIKSENLTIQRRREATPWQAETRRDDPSTAAPTGASDEELDSGQA